MLIVLAGMSPGRVDVFYLPLVNFKVGIKSFIDNIAEVSIGLMCNMFQLFSFRIFGHK